VPTVYDFSAMRRPGTSSFRLRAMLRCRPAAVGTPVVRFGRSDMEVPLHDG